MAPFLTRVLSARTLATVALAAVLIMAVGVAGQIPGTTSASAVQALVGAQRSCDARQVQDVSLPDMVEVPRGTAGPARCVYRLVVKGAPSGFGIFIPRLAAHAVISVNGKEVSNSLTDPMLPAPRSVDRIVLLEVPGVLWVDSDNVIEIKAAGPTQLALSKVRVGPIAQLKHEHRVRVLGAVVGPSLVAAIVSTLGLCILLLWISRRDSLYGYFGAGTLFWGIHTLWTVSPWSPLSGDHLIVWWTTLYTFFVSMLIIFCVRFAEWNHPRVERLLWVVPAATPVALYAAVALDRIDLADNLVRLVLLAMVGLGVAAVVWASWKRPDVDKSFVVASGFASFGFGLHDWLANLRANGDNPIYLVPYAGLIFVVFVVRMLISRFASVADQIEQMNVELEQRVATQNTELRDAMEKMRQARDEAEAADHAKTRFLAAASHDLRQPAHALALYMAALRAERLDERQADLVERMSGSLSALGALFDMLLDMSRIDAGALAPAANTFAIEPLLRRLADEFAPQADAQGLRLALRLPSADMADTAFTHSDPVLVERVVRNLLANAVKYTSHGGVLLACRRRRGSNTGAPLVARRPRWRIEVWDTGVGIADEDKGRVFEEFFQVDTPGRDRARGLGLGLSIVHRVVKLLGLELELHSRLGRGSCFALYLPQVSGAAGASIMPPLDTTAPAVIGLRVGLIEDDIMVRDAMRTLLLRWGCEVVEGADAAELDLQTKERGWTTLPHALLVDQRLASGKTGPAQARVLFKRWGAEVPVLVVSGESDLSPVKAAGWPCLAKPLSPTLLMAWLATVPVLPRQYEEKVREHAGSAGELS